MKVILEIDNFDNDAMTEVDQRELKNDIQEKMYQALMIHHMGLMNGTVYDHNGNKVGEMLIQI